MVNTPNLKLKPWHREALRRLTQGQTCRQVATDIGCHPDALSRIANTPAGKEYLAKLDRMRELAAIGHYQTLPTDKTD